MAKRVSMWLIALAMMCCSMAGCVKKPELTPEEVYEAACEKLNHLDGIDMDLAMDVVITAEGETREMGLDVDLQMEHPYGEDMKMAMSMNMDLSEMGPNLQDYYVDGYYLTDMNGRKVKYPMSLEDAMGYSAMVQELPPDALSDITMTEENGWKILTFSVDAKSLMGEDMKEYLSNVPLVINSKGMTYQAFQGVMKVNEEGYPVDITMEIVYTTWAGAKWDCNAAVTVIYNDPGQPVIVEIPDTSEYIEVDPETMF